MVQVRVNLYVQRLKRERKRRKANLIVVITRRIPVHVSNVRVRLHSSTEWLFTLA